MLRYTTDRARPGLVALYDIRPGNGAGQFLQPWSLHGAYLDSLLGQMCTVYSTFKRIQKIYICHSSSPNATNW